MGNLINITEIVLDILKTEPETRSSDYELYFHVCKTINPRIIAMQFGSVMKNHKDLGIPAFETVSRCRRKVVEKHPSLAGVEQVECQRSMNEETFKKYAKGAMF